MEIIEGGDVSEETKRSYTGAERGMNSVVLRRTKDQRLAQQIEGM